MSDLDERIAEVKGSNSVIVVVPNDSIREKYREHFAKAAKENEALKDRVTVVVLYELGYHLDSLLKRRLTSEESTSRRW